jgi:hypothetical protein
MRAYSNSRHGHLRFYAFYQTLSCAPAEEVVGDILGVVHEQMPRFCDLRLTPLDRLAAVGRIANLLPDELASIPFSPEGTVRNISAQLAQHPNYAFDQDAMSAMIRAGIALGIQHDYDPRIVDTVVRGLKVYGAVPRALGRMQIDEAVESAQVSRWKEAADRTRQMGAEADLLSLGQRFAVLAGRARERRNG